MDLKVRELLDLLFEVTQSSTTLDGVRKMVSDGDEVVSLIQSLCAQAQMTSCVDGRIRLI